MIFPGIALAELFEVRCVSLWVIFPALKPVSVFEKLGKLHVGVFHSGCAMSGRECLTPKLSDAVPVAAMLAAESAEQAAWVTLGRRSLERNVRLFGEFHGDACNDA